MYLFIAGALLGLFYLLSEALKNEWPLVSLEGLFAIIIYPALSGWMLCFAWKIIQWPFS